LDELRLFTRVFSLLKLEVGQDVIIEFMDTNKNKLREMSLRMAIKIAQLYKSFPNTWEKMARSTCMKVA
jgi:hypothetical protein